MPKNERELRVEVLGGRDIISSWLESQPIGNSLFFYCYRCGSIYARAPGFVDGKLAPWHGIAGLCQSSTCAEWENKFIVPGSVRTHWNWPHNPPLEVMIHEFLCELAHYDQRYKELELVS